MKLSSLIFAIYILSLCAYPCQDNGDHDNFGAKSTYKIVTCDGHHDSNCCHKCSPFCFCNCCHVNIVVTIPLDISISITNPAICDIAYIEFRLKEIPEQIWQPPKLLV